MHSQTATKEFARSAVVALAPDEIDMFEQLWAEALQDPALLHAQGGSHTRHLGMGIDGDVSLLSLVIIPMVIAVSKAVAGDAAKQAYDYIKKQLTGSQAQTTGLTEQQIEQLAHVLSERLANASRRLPSPGDNR